MNKMDVMMKMLKEEKDAPESDSMEAKCCKCGAECTKCAEYKSDDE